MQKILLTLRELAFALTHGKVQFHKTASQKSIFLMEGVWGANKYLKLLSTRRNQPPEFRLGFLVGGKGSVAHAFSGAPLELE